MFFCHLLMYILSLSHHHLWLLNAMVVVIVSVVILYVTSEGGVDCGFVNKVT